MLRNIPYTTRLLVMLGVCVLSACGGGGSDTPDPSRVLQESELYHPVTNPTGVMEQSGQTVVLGLQANTSDLPPLPSTPNKGVEDLWFEVKDAQSMQIALDADMLVAIDRVEIRDQNNALLATINATAPSTMLTLAPGRYQALVYASAADTEPVPAFVQYATSQSGNTQAQGVLETDKAQPQAVTRSINNIHVTGSCPGCNLRGFSFPNWRFNGVDFSGANLEWVSFYKARLLEPNFSKARLTMADFSGADLPKANFSGANLRDAQFLEANLYGVNFSGADLRGVAFRGAILVNVIWGSEGPPCVLKAVVPCR